MSGETQRKYVKDLIICVHDILMLLLSPPSSECETSDRDIMISGCHDRSALDIRRETMHCYMR